MHSLINIRTLDDLHGHPVSGNSWEGFVIEQVIGVLPASTPVCFYRTSAGAEIDMLFFDSKNQPVALEIKYSLSPELEKGFWIAYDDLACKKGFVVYPGEDAYPIGRGTFTLPLKQIECLAGIFLAA